MLHKHILCATEKALLYLPCTTTLYPTLFERLAHASVDVEGLTADVIDEPPEMDSKRRAPRQATRP
jgi:hypothetical protein